MDWASERRRNHASWCTVAVKITTLISIRNYDTEKEAHVKPIETFPKNKWFGHC